MPLPEIEAAFEELTRVCPIMPRMSYDHLGDTGLQWQCVDDDDPGTQYLYEASFDTDDGLGLITPVEHRPPTEQMNGEYPLVPSTGRIEQHFNCGEKTSCSATLNHVVPENFVEIHPDDVKDRGIQGGDLVVVETRRGEVEIKADVTNGANPGVIWSMSHFPDALINDLTTDATVPERKPPNTRR